MRTLFVAKNNDFISTINFLALMSFHTRNPSSGEDKGKYFEECWELNSFGDH